MRGGGQVDRGVCSKSVDAQWETTLETGRCTSCSRSRIIEQRTTKQNNKVPITAPAQAPPLPSPPPWPIPGANTPADRLPPPNPPPNSHPPKPPPPPSFARRSSTGEWMRGEPVAVVACSRLSGDGWGLSPVVLVAVSRVAAAAEVSLEGSVGVGVWGSKGSVGGLVWLWRCWER